VINLVANARDAVNGDGRIVVRMDIVTLDGDSGRRASVEPGRYAHLTVNDTGHGIPPEIRSRIFEPFFTTKPSGKGSGLGLAMVHGIVRRAGGGVSVESSPNVAPVAAPPREPASAPAPAAELTHAG
jgi:signal transduction histidine kinase